MANWDFRDDQLSDSERRRLPKKDKNGNDVYESYEDSSGNTWVYGRRGWRILGDYDG